MRNQTALAGLLDRADRVFALADRMGRTWQEDHRRQGDERRVDLGSWARHRPDYDAFCRDLLDLGEAIQNPPAGFDGVAAALRRAVCVAQDIRAVMATAGGQMWANYLERWPELNTVADEGRRALANARRAMRPADPLDALAAMSARPARIDTTPAVIRPPEPLIDAAARAIPLVLLNTTHDQSGRPVLPASHLAKRLQEAGHTLAAAHWAVHRAIEAGHLRAERLAMPLPGAIVPGGPGGAHATFGGGQGLHPIPAGRPAPYEAFAVAPGDSFVNWASAVLAPPGAEAAGAGATSPAPVQALAESATVPTAPAVPERAEGGKPGPKKSRTSKDEAEVLVREHLRENAAVNPALITRDGVAAATGVSAGAVSKTAAWIAFKERRDAHKQPTGREVSLPDGMQAVVPDDEARRRAEQEELDRLIDEQQADDRRDSRRRR